MSHTIWKLSKITLNHLWLISHFSIQTLSQKTREDAERPSRLCLQTPSSDGNQARSQTGMRTREGTLFFLVGVGGSQTREEKEEVEE